MFNRTYQIRARRSKLEGEQLDLTFPRRGRPTRIRVLERCGQMRLNLQPGAAKLSKFNNSTIFQEQPETFDDALQMTFPVRPPTELELEREFHRLFPCE